MLVAAIVPVIELVRGYWIAGSAISFDAVAMLIFLLAIFTTAIAINMIRGRLDIDCGCFGRCCVNH